MPPLVPGLTITSELSSRSTGSTWAAVRSHDDRALVVRIFRVSDVARAQARARGLMAVLHRIGNEHLARQHEVLALADGTLALVLDQVPGGSLEAVLGARGRLTPGETVTTVAPLFGALGELHAAGVVHGDLAPASILFSADGRPLICDLGVAGLLARPPGPVDGTSGFVAPELVDGGSPSPASDVYAMAAIGWFALTGAPPAAAPTRPSLATVTSEAPPRLVEVLTSCLSTDPSDRPSADAAAVEVFDAAAARSVGLGAVSDPAAEITRRIRATAVTAAIATAPPARRGQHGRPVILVMALFLAVALGGGATWFGRDRPIVTEPMAHSATTPSPVTASAATGSTVAPARTPTAFTDVVSAPSSPRKNAAALLQALVDARALAYLARNPSLLDLVYAPGAAKVAADRSNIARAREMGATYLGLAFIVKDAAFLDGTSDAARIRATIITPAYETGQPDGRRVSHPREIVGPSVFTLSLAPDGWRILALTQP